MQGMIYAFLALIPYVIFILTNRYASQRIGPAAFVVIVNMLSVIAPTAIILASRVQGKQIVNSGNHGRAYAMTILGGICIGIYGLFLSKAFATGNVAVVSPVFAGGSSVLSALGAYIVFGEKVNLAQFAGIVLIIAGIGVVVASKARA
jgi:uncharacterized membrane protein